MRTLARYTAGGVAAGFIATTLVAVLFPQFLTRLPELVVLPVLGASAGFLIGVVALAVRRIRRLRPGPVIGRRSLIMIVASALLSASVYGLRAPVRAWKVSPTLITLCIDGGTWSVIDPLIAAGRLPHLANLKANGTSAVLLSEEPMFSMILWTTIGTGVRPDKHGIKTFYDTQDHLRSKRIWEVFEDSGRSIGLFRWWTTWPPRVKNGFVIPDILARDASAMPPAYNFVNQLRIDMKAGHPMSPLHLMTTGWRFLQAGLRLETCLGIAGEMLPALLSRRFADFHIASRRAEIRLNADVYCHLLREFEPEFTCFYDNGIDQMSHFYWQYYQPGGFKNVTADDVARYGNVVPDYYELHDQIIGEILEHVDPNANKIVLSDHGFTAVETGAENFFFASGVPILADMGMDAEYYSVALASRTFVESVKREADANLQALESAVDIFNSLTVKETGARLFRAWIEDEGRIQLNVSDSLRSLDGQVDTPTGLVPVNNWFTTRIYTGTHHPEGIFIAVGPVFRWGHAGTPAQLVDVAPTILHATGFPLSRELDGSVKTDWLLDEFRQEHGVEWVDSYGHYDPVRGDVVVDKETMRKLRALGYLR